MSVILEAKDVTMRFGGLTAVNRVNMKVAAGKIHLLIGPNGAGKTTFFNVVTGMYIPTEGNVIFNGEDITKYPPHKITEKGIARTFQNILLFDDMPVIDNVMVGCHCRINTNIVMDMFHTGRMRNEEKKM